MNRKRFQVKNSETNARQLPIRGTRAEAWVVSFFQKDALSVLVVTSPCHPWLSPLLVTLTGEPKKEKILCAIQQGNMELGTPPMAVVLKGMER